MNDRTEYCVGFVFPDARDKVLLIRKNRPTWQAGKLNGIGGKVETGESPLAAMEREFLEEAGILLDNWDHSAIMLGPGVRLDVFCCISTEAFYQASTQTDEELLAVDIGELHRRDDVLPNLLTHISIALDRSGLVKPVFLIDDRARQ